jgi:hypothetical protein
MPERYQQLHGDLPIYYVVSFVDTTQYCGLMAISSINNGGSF